MKRIALGMDQDLRWEIGRMEVPGYECTGWVFDKRKDGLMGTYKPEYYLSYAVLKKWLDLLDDEDEGTWQSAQVWAEIAELIGEL